jgi:outer membrane lipoprotein carrier protein
MKRGILAILLFLLLPLQGVFAQPVGTDEVIQRLREVREKTKDFSADLLQEKKVSMLKEKIVSRGRIRYKYPDKVSIEFFQPEASQMVFDGKTLLLYYREEKAAERYQAQSSPMVEKYLLFSQDPFQEKLAAWKIVEDHDSSLMMEIHPKGEDFLFVKARFWISKRDWMVTGMEMVEKNGDTTLLRYSNIRLNTGLTDSDFELRLPADVKVTDVK